jgi:FkbM family methyltransferase
MEINLRLAARSLPGWIGGPLRRLRSKFVDPFARASYSQEGEDMILRQLFEGRESGFYVDVGAHHPRRFSNTCFFYQRGWRGINIEPNPEAAAGFRSERPRDINLQMGVSTQEGVLTYYFFNDAALNSFNKDLSDLRVRTSEYKVIATKEIPVNRLESILRLHLPAHTKIDFMTIDVEGFDFEVIQSNDWSAFRPTCVLVECLDTSFEEVLESETFRFMREQGYALYAKTANNLIFALPH